MERQAEGPRPYAEHINVSRYAQGVPWQLLFACMRGRSTKRGALTKPDDGFGWMQGSSKVDITRGGHRECTPGSFNDVYRVY